MSSTPEASNHGDSLDENLYSRQLYVLGHEAMKKMQQSNVLIVGLGGLGVEVAKNVILTGVKSVSLYDTKDTTWFDLTSQFYLSPDCIGKNRAEASLNHLKDLNPYVPVSIVTGELSELISTHNVVVFTDHLISDLVELNEIARKNNVNFIAAETHGVTGAVFVDFGSQFEVFDVDGENTISNIVTNITNDNPATVVVHDDKQTHGLYDDDLVVFEDVEGMTELNSLAEPLSIKSTGKHEFTVNIDTTKFSKYKSGGYVRQVKKKKVVDFLPLNEALKKPSMMETDFAKLERPAELHACYRALADFHKQNKRLPRPYNKEDSDQFLSLVKEYHDKIPEDIARKFSHTSMGNLNPLAAFVGGIAAQEVQKACSGKFHPINQWMYFDSLESLPETLEESDTKPLDSRYDGQIVVYGQKFQKQLMDKRVFIVGAGALGCEYLKNFAMMGVGTGPKGKIFVTDMDTIEISNLNRQFLFRKKHVGKMKSVIATEVAKEMNSSLNVVALSDKVAPNTEEVFDDDFWQGLDVVVNALDNIQARLYVDSRCVYYRKPLVEAGTLGTKGNVQVVIPHLTESYGSTPDPPEKEIPICTLKNFPNAIEHTIQWARDLFEGLFKQVPDDVNSYLSKPDFLQELESQGGNKISTLENIHESLVRSRPISFDECIVWARLKFEDLYNNSIQQLLFNFPLDMVTSSGAPFWGGPKRPPTPLKFDPNDKTHLGFIIATANLRAQIFGLKGHGKDYDFKKVLDGVSVPKFVPKAGIKISTSEAEAKEEKQSHQTDDEICTKLTDALPKTSALAGFRLASLSFEKDDDTNFHMDFVTAASNLRARNYKIKEADMHQTKGIAGKIIPAMVTTTALITGIASLELIKIVVGKQKIDEYKNAFVNIAIPFVTMSEPMQPQKHKMKEKEWTLWDRFDVNVGRDMSLKEFMDHFEREHKLTITMMSSGTAVVYSFFQNKKKLAERLPMKLSEVVKEITKLEFLPKQRYINFEVCCTDEEGEDVDVPYVRYQFRFFQ